MIAGLLIPVRNVAFVKIERRGRVVRRGLERVPRDICDLHGMTDKTVLSLVVLAAI